MKKWIIAIAVAAFIAVVATSRAQVSRLTATQPSNCATATGYPCVHLSWSDASAAATVTNSPAGVEQSGPVGIAVLRCTGDSTVCTSASLPSQSGTQQAVGNSTWTVVTGSSPVNQTTTAADYYDNTSLVYGTTYTWTAVAWFTGTGGGPVSGYSNFSTATFGAAPKATPSAPGSVTGTQVN